MAFLRVRDVENLVAELLSIGELSQWGQVNRHCWAVVQGNVDYLEAKRLSQLAGPRLEASQASLRVLQYLYRRNPAGWFRWAFQFGRLDLATWISTQEVIGLSELDVALAELCFKGNGDVKMAELLWAKNPGLDLDGGIDDVFQAACDRGHLRLAQWMLEKRSHQGMVMDLSRYCVHYSCDPFWLSVLADQVEVVRWLWSIGHFWFTPAEYQYCQRSGQTQMCELLFSLNPSMTLTAPPESLLGTVVHQMVRCG